jgi:hypothetical protein
MFLLLQPAAYCYCCENGDCLYGTVVAKVRLSLWNCSF